MISFLGRTELPPTENDTERVARLAELLCQLVAEISTFPTIRGQEYLKMVCGAARKLILAIGKIPQHFQSLSLSTSSAASRLESYQWNQTVNIVRLPKDPLEHLIDAWERWTMQVREAAHEISDIAGGNPGSYSGTGLGSLFLGHSSDNLTDDSDRSATYLRIGRWSVIDISRRRPQDQAEADETLETSSETTSPLIQSNLAEKKIAQEAEALIKHARAIMRKTRSKVLPKLDPQSFQDCSLIDSFHAAGRSITAAADELASALTPPASSTPTIVAIILEDVGRAMDDILALVLSRCDEQSNPWFRWARNQFECLLGPILERNPCR